MPLPSPISSFARIVARYPANRFPGSTTEVNCARLPAAESLVNSDFAYREQTLSDAAAARFCELTLLKYLALIPACVYGLVAGYYFYVHSLVVLVAVGALLVMLVRLFLFRERDPLTLLRTFFYPISLALLAGVLRLATNRDYSFILIASLVYLGLTLVVTYLGGPFTFYWHWLASHPRFSTAERRHLKNMGPWFGMGRVLRQLPGWRRLPPAFHSWLVPVGMLLLSLGMAGGVMYLATAFSSGSANEKIFVAVAMPLLFIVLLLVFSPLRALRSFGIVWGPFLTYSGRASGAAGVWIPAETLEKRVAHLQRLILSLAIALFTLTTYFGEHPSATDIADERALSGLTKLTYDAIAATDSALTMERLTQPDPNSLGGVTERLLYSLKVFGNAVAGPIDVLGPVFLGNLGQAILLVTSVFFVMFAPVTLVLSSVGRYVEAGGDFWAADETANLANDSLWEQHVARLRTSAFAASDPLTNATVSERQHLFLGFEPHQNFPILLDQGLLGEHCYIVGDSGSGKTSLGIMPLLFQIIRGNAALPHTGAQISLLDSYIANVHSLLPDPTAPSPPSVRPTPLFRVGKASWVGNPPVSLLVLDLKGDSALFHSLRAEAHVRGQEFRYFTPEKGRASDYFNPFQDLNPEARSLSSFCNLLLDALSLNHGEGYGRGYYTARNRHVLQTVLQDTKATTFEELSAALASSKGLTRRAREEAFELLVAMKMLASYDVLQTKPTASAAPYEERTIHMARLIEESEIAYFWLPAAIESISVREIGKLALFALVAAAHERQRNGLPPKPVYVVVDEFQRLAGENFSVLLEQARSLGLHLILANQTISDLNTPSKDLRPAVRTNTRVKMFFSLTEFEEIDQLSKLSGLDIAETHSRSTSRFVGGLIEPRTESESVSETTQARLLASDIQRYSDHPNQFILHVSRGRGFTQFGGLPVPVQTMWPLAQPMYETYRDTPWPEALRPTFSGQSAQHINTTSPQEVEDAARNDLASYRAALLNELANPD